MQYIKEERENSEAKLELSINIRSKLYFSFRYNYI